VLEGDAALVVDPAANWSRVAADRAVDDLRWGCVVERAAAVVGNVVAERAVGDLQRALVVDRATTVIRAHSACQGEAVKLQRDAGFNAENALEALFML